MGESLSEEVGPLKGSQEGRTILGRASRVPRGSLLSVMFLINMRFWQIWNQIIKINMEDNGRGGQKTILTALGTISGEI